MDSAGINDRVKRYITENFLYTRPDYDLEPTEPLLGTGVLDSMGVVELVEFIHDEFGIPIADSEITAGNFGSLAAIAAYVERKCAEFVAA